MDANVTCSLPLQVKYNFVFEQSRVNKSEIIILFVSKSIL